MKNKIFIIGIGLLFVFLFAVYGHAENPLQEISDSISLEATINKENSSADLILDIEGKSFDRQDILIKDKNGEIIIELENVFLSDLQRGISFDIEFLKGANYPVYNSLTIYGTVPVALINNILSYLNREETADDINTNPEILNDIMDDYNITVEYPEYLRLIKEDTLYRTEVKKGYTDAESYKEEIEEFIEGQFYSVNSLLTADFIFENTGVSVLSYISLPDFDVEVNVSTLKWEKGVYNIPVTLIYEDERITNNVKVNFNLEVEEEPEPEPEAPQETRESSYKKREVEKRKIGDLKESQAEISMGKGDVVEFSVFGNSHELSIEQIWSNKAKIKIQSNPLYLILFVGDEKEVDLDGDGIKDLYIKLNEIRNKKAYLTIKQAEVVEEEPIVVIEEPKEEEEKIIIPEPQKEKFPWGWLLAFAIVLVIVILILVMRRNGKKAYKELMEKEDMELELPPPKPE